MTMKYTGTVNIHEASPFYSNLRDEVYRKLFTCEDVRRGMAIPLWYWQSKQNTPVQVNITQTVQPSGERFTHYTAINQERWVALALTDPGWHSCEVYSNITPTAIPGELKINKTTAQYLNAPEYDSSFYDTALNEWRSKWDRHVIIRDGELEEELNLSNEPRHEPLVLDLADYGGDPLKMMSTLLILADRKTA